MHKILRNGKPFDSLDPATHAIKQMVASWAREDPGATYSAHDDKGEYYSYCVSTPKAWQVTNGPFFTGGEVTESSRD